MLSIQDIGLSIMGDSPKNFYILGGKEYGIKDKYIEILVSKFGSKIEYETVQEVVALFSKHHIIPLESHVYVVRYDKTFVSQASKDSPDRILSLGIIGTLVLVYEDAKDLGKLDKVFPDNTASIDAIDIKHMVKHLKSDFPDLDDLTVTSVAKYSDNYFHAKNICRCLDCVSGKYMLTEKQIISLFGLQTAYSNDEVQIAVASRNFNALVHILEHYEGDPQNILYQILRVMVELDKVQSSKFSNSTLKQYANKWQPADIYYMFNHTYEAIKSMRSGYAADVSDLIVYLGALMCFQTIPDTRLLK